MFCNREGDALRWGESRAESPRAGRSGASLMQLAEINEANSSGVFAPVLQKHVRSARAAPYLKKPYFLHWTVDAFGEAAHQPPLFPPDQATTPPAAFKVAPLSSVPPRDGAAAIPTGAASPALDTGRARGAAPLPRPLSSPLRRQLGRPRGGPTRGGAHDSFPPSSGAQRPRRRRAEGSQVG